LVDNKIYLLKERECLRGDVAPNTKATEDRLFTGDLGPKNLADNILTVLSAVNSHIEQLAPQESASEIETQALDSKWREILPEWFTTKFVVFPDKDNNSAEFEGLSDKEIAAKLRSIADSYRGRSPALTRWLLSFNLEERFWFYDHHEIQDNILTVAVQQSEHPTPMYSLIDLVEMCGGTEVEQNTGKIARLRNIFGFS